MPETTNLRHGRLEPHQGGAPVLAAFLARAFYLLTRPLAWSQAASISLTPPVTSFSLAASKAIYTPVTPRVVPTACTSPHSSLMSKRPLNICSARPIGFLSLTYPNLNSWCFLTARISQASSAQEMTPSSSWLFRPKLFLSRPSSNFSAQCVGSTRKPAPERDYLSCASSLRFRVGESGSCERRFRF